MAQRKIKITLPTDLTYLPLILNSVKSLGKILGFDDAAVSDLETGAKEAVSSVVKYAFQEDENATFDIVLEPQATGLKIIIKEMGLPFDPSQMQEQISDSTKKDLNYKGRAEAILNQLLDEVSFHNLGKAGMETHLFKYFDQHVQHLMNQEELQEVNEEKPVQKIPEEIHYSVRRMKPEEALEVSKVAYSTYGYTYINDDVYYPDRLRELNEKNNIISYVAVTDDGEIIAHNAFEKRQDKNIPELGIACTKPAYRGRGCLNRLTTLLLEDAEKLKFTGIFALGITTHPFSQKSLIKFGFRGCGLYLSKGLSRTYKGIEQKKLQRESMVLFFQYVAPPQKLTIYPPSHHLDMILGIYDHIGFKPEIKITDTQQKPDHHKSVVSAVTNQNSLVADIYVKTYGQDIVEEVHRIFRNLCINRMETIYLRMPLKNPFTAKFTAEFEKLGFFFCGVLPRSKGNDELILQYLNNYVIDFDLLQIASDKGLEILEYIKQQTAENKF